MFRLLSQIKFGNISKKFLDKPGLQRGWRLFPFAFKKDKYKIVGKIFINNKKIKQIIYLKKRKIKNKEKKNADFVELVKAVYRFRWNRNK